VPQCMRYMHHLLLQHVCLKQLHQAGRFCSEKSDSGCRFQLLVHKGKDLTPRMKTLAQVVLSEVLGSMAYFHGSSLVRLPSAFGEKRVE
jgi:hypothetical protein